MATKTVPGSTTPAHPSEEGVALADLIPFATDADMANVVEDDQTPALAFNPAASLAAVLSCAMARAATLHQTLRLWAMVERAGDVDPAQVAAAVEPTAQEVRRLLDEIQRRLQVAAEGGAA